MIAEMVTEDYNDEEVPLCSPDAIILLKSNQMNKTERLACSLVPTELSIIGIGVLDLGSEVMHSILILITTVNHTQQPYLSLIIKYTLYNAI